MTAVDSRLGAPSTKGAPLLGATGLRVVFRARRRRDVVAVDGVDLDLGTGEALGLVGESGCGKTTVARVLAGLQPASEGGVQLHGQSLPTKRTASQRRAVQMVFQDPTSSLNPRMTIGTMLRQLLFAHFGRRGEEASDRSGELLSLVGLPPSTLQRYPRELSGGQRQRVAIARALAVEPQVIVADEPTSALDVSVQATILRLFAELRATLGIGVILISHNLAATRALCDRIDVMYLGRIVERGARDEVFQHPSHPYTRALLASAPSLVNAGWARRDPAAPGDSVPTRRESTLESRLLDPDARDAARLALHGEPPSPSAIPDGCRLHPRCPLAERICSTDDPELGPVHGDARHLSACHFRDQLTMPALSANSAA